LFYRNDAKEGSILLSTKSPASPRRAQWEGRDGLVFAWLFFKTGSPRINAAVAG